MPQQSKYSNEQIEALMSDVLLTLNKDGDNNTELMLMVLGNSVTAILEQNVPAGVRKSVAEKFSEVLVKSVS
ncbi:MAG: DUF1414 domain-containing protein [Alteromonadaceae bacterium]|nr:DUF1414 domain-containing protein [Alteromonadaceae bacterium]